MDPAKSLKKILYYIFAGLIGYLVISELYILFFVFGLTSFGILFRPDIDLFAALFWFVIIAGWVVLISGIYFGIKSYRIKNTFYKIMKPNRKNVLLSFVISLILIVLAVAFSGEEVFGYIDLTTNTIQYFSLIYSIPISILYYFVFFYPFSAFLYYYYKNRKIKFPRKTKLIIIVLLILLNPFFIIISTPFYGLIVSNSLNEPCGVRIVNVLPNSAAEEAGMQTGEVIVKIDDFDIRNAQDLTNFSNSIDYNKSIIITTDKNNYSLTLRFNESLNRYQIGVDLNVEFCRRYR